MAITKGKWLDIAPDYQDTLVLGNGASIAIHDGFNYTSLLEKARAKSLITVDLDTIFKTMNTRDFELVLRYISIAEYVNRALGIEDGKTHTAYQDIRKALIETVRIVHPEYEIAKPHLKPAYEFMSRFNVVVSLNYDLLVYWAMMLGNEQPDNNDHVPFKDCFVSGSFSAECLWNEIKQKKSTLVFYPHGNLALAVDPGSGEFKIARDKNNGTPLLEQIIKEWQQDFRTPLFVAEGDEKQKLKAIQSSGYLSTIYYDVLPTLGDTVAIYGWSLGDNDEHILERLCKGKSKIAISIDQGSVPNQNVEKHCVDMRAKIKTVNEQMQDANIIFYDAASEGCWIHPQAAIVPA